MNYYYYGDDNENFYGLLSPWKYFSQHSSRGSSFFPLKSEHKRLIFTAISLYLCYRLTHFLLSTIGSLIRWIRKSEEEYGEDGIAVAPVPRSRIGLFLERSFVLLFGLGVGALAYYTHQTQTDKLLETGGLIYRKAVNQIVLHSTGFDLTRTTLAPNESLVLGTLLAGFSLYIMYSMVGFLLHHYIFGTALSLFGLFLYFYQFPITAHTAQTYTGTLFVIDRTAQVAYLVPSLIPKVLLTLTMCYYLLLVLLRSFTLFLKISLRFLLYSVIAAILLNYVTSVLSGPSNLDASTTTFTPNHRF